MLRAVMALFDRFRPTSCVARGATDVVGAFMLATVVAAGCGNEVEKKERPAIPFVPETAGCNGAALLERPSDCGERGPWPVGTRRVRVGRLDVDVFYPAERGSDFDVPAATFDIRTFLPPSQQSVVPDERNPVQRCDCFRDLPPDDAYGPWPVIVFVHGTASFSTQSLADVTHWVSRGFVVLAATHPGLYLADQLSVVCPDERSGDRDLAADLAALLAAAKAPTDGLAFLAGALDGRFALVGHSAGANAVVDAASSDTTGDVKAVISLSGSAAYTGSGASFLALAGTADNIVRLSASQDAFNTSSAPRRFVALENAGHLSFSDLCETRNADGENLLTIAEDEGVCGASLAGFLFDCSPDHQDPLLSRSIVQASTTWLLEEQLHCARPTSDFSVAVSALEGVVSVNEELTAGP